MVIMSDDARALRSRPNAGPVFGRAVDHGPWIDARCATNDAPPGRSTRCRLRRVLPESSGRSFVARRSRLLVVLLLAFHGALLCHTALENSETFDEPMYLLASRSYYEAGDFSFNREHPPLSKLLIGLPLWLAGLEVQPDYQMNGATQLRFVYELNDVPQRTLFLGRLPMIAVSLLLGFYVYLFGRRCGGARGEETGLAALAAYGITPGILGNAPLAALDLGAAAFATIALYHLGALRQAPSRGRILVAGVTLGLAQLTKFSNLLMLPVYAAIAGYDALVQRSLRPLLRLAALSLVAGTTMFAGYGFEMRTVESVKGHPRYDDDPATRAEGHVFGDPLLRRITAWFGDRPVPMLTYLKGYDYLKRTADQEGHASYFRGEVKKGEGWREFYLVSLAVKTPIGMLALTALALLLLPWLPRARGFEAPLLVFPALLLAYFSFANSQLGLRYVLPVLPALAVIAGRAVAFDAARHRRIHVAALALALIVLPVALGIAFEERGPVTLALLAFAGAPIVLGLGSIAAALWPVRDDVMRRGGRMLALALLACGALEVLLQHPHHLMFFNAFAGGPDRGYRILSVGDDWGQGTSELAEYQRDNGLPEIAYDYYGTGVPEIYGLRYRAFDGQPTSGLVAVHAIQLTRERHRPVRPPRYAFLDGLEPIARINAILLFDVPADASGAPRVP
jgi:hypothetical protein